MDWDEANASWQQVAAACDEAVRSGLEDLTAALAVPSISARRSGLMQSAEQLRALLRRDGWTCDVHQAGPNPVVFATCDLGRAPRRSLLIYGHHDVQPAEPLDAWTTPAFEPSLRDGRVYARGAADNKGQFFCHLFAVRALRRLALDLPVRLKLVLDGEEEMGSPNIHRFIEEQRDALAADLVYTADGPVHASGCPVVSFGVRGVLKLRLRVRTASRDLHSGNWGNIAPSAGLRLAQILAQLKGPDGRVRVPGFYDDVRPASAAEREALREIPFDEAAVRESIGADALDGPADVTAMERLMFLPTFNVAGITAGYTGPGFKTVIPGEAVAQIDVRLVADQDPQRVFALLRDHLAEQAPEARLEHMGQYLPSRTPIDTKWAEVVVRAVARGFGEQPLRYPSLGASSPDALFAKGLGLPSVLVPYGNHDESNHAPDENMRLDHLEKGTRTSAALFALMAEER